MVCQKKTDESPIPNFTKPVAIDMTLLTGVSTIKYHDLYKHDFRIQFHVSATDGQMTVEATRANF